MTNPQPKLQTVVFALDDLTAFHKNARRGDTDAIAESLRELGQFRPIVVNKGTHTGRPNEVLAGNHTVYAARLEGMATIEATVVDVDETTAAKIVLADNRTNDLATYDDDTLDDLLADLGRDGLLGTGFTEEDWDSRFEDADLPDPLDTGGSGTGTGESAAAENLSWGYIGWSTTRVKITGDEVRALDEAYERYCDEHGTATGFGHHLVRSGLVGSATEPAEA